MSCFVETKRTKLYKPKKSDLKELYDLMSKPEVNIFNPMGADSDIKTTQRKLNKWIYDWEQNGIGYYIVRDIHTNEFIGYIGVSVVVFCDTKLLNLAYRIEPKFQRQAYVNEVCKKVIRLSFIKYPNTLIRILTKKQNKPSINVAKRLGFVYNKKFDDYPFKDDIYFFNVDTTVSSKLQM